MIRRCLILALLCLALPVLPAEAARPVSFGAQWTWTSVPSGGIDCLSFPGGATVRHLSWQSSTKVSGEALFWLVGGGLPRQLPPYLNGGVVILATHHPPGRSIAQVREITVDWEISAGGFVWTVGGGDGAAHPAPLEAQVTLWIDGPEVSAVAC